MQFRRVCLSVGGGFKKFGKDCEGGECDAGEMMACYALFYYLVAIAFCSSHNHESFILCHIPMLLFKHSG